MTDGHVAFDAAERACRPVRTLRGRRERDEQADGFEQSKAGSIGA